jgi:hypothetical protein
VPSILCLYMAVVREVAVQEGGVGLVVRSARAVRTVAANVCANASDEQGIASGGGCRTWVRMRQTYMS